MITYYVSPAPADGGTGDDANDGLTPSTPKATIQAANDLITNPRTDSVNIMLSNLGTHVSTATITVPVATDYRWSQNYLCWEESTSGNYVNLNGDMVPRWLWVHDGTGDRFHVTQAPMAFYDGKFSSVSSISYCIVGGVTCLLHNIEIDATNMSVCALYSSSTRYFINHCRFVANDPYPTYMIYGAIFGRMQSTFLSGVDYNHLAVGGALVEGCVFENWGNVTNKTAIMSAQGAVVRNNVFNGAGNGLYGIANYVSYGQMDVYNNVFLDLTDAMLDWTSGNPAHMPGGYIGHNAFYNVTNRYSNIRGGYTSLIDPDATDLTLTADPFVDSANGDYRLLPNSTLRGRGFVPTMGVYPGSGYTLSTTSCDIGPIQYGTPNLPFAPGFIG